MKFVLFTLFLFATSCSTLDSIDPKTPKGAFQLAERYEKAERFEEAVIRYSEIRTKFPYSKLAIDAQLRIADIQFKREYFEEAASAYQIFREVNPKYSRLEYVIYKIATSFFMQLPSNNARDLSASKEALNYYTEYIEKYPKGSWIKEAKENKQTIYDKLSKKEMYIADFYFKRGEYFSALGRYQSVSDQYSFLPLAKQASLQAILCAIKLDYKDIAQKYYNIMKKRYPDSKEFREAQVKGEPYGLL